MLQGLLGLLVLGLVVGWDFVIFLIVAAVIGMVIWLFKESGAATDQAVATAAAEQKAGMEMKRLSHDLITQHIHELSTKERQLTYGGSYGMRDTRRWDKEKRHFIDRIIKPKWNHAYTFPADEIAAYIDSKIDEYRSKYPDLAEPNVALNAPSITPTQYEFECAKTLRGAGWLAQVTKASGDYGADVIATKQAIKVAIQCKRYASPVGIKAVQEVHSARSHYGATHAVVVATVGYTAAAHQMASSTGVLLLHHDDLPRLEFMIA